MQKLPNRKVNKEKERVRRKEVKNLKKKKSQEAEKNIFILTDISGMQI